VLAIAAVLISAKPMLATLRFPVRLEFIVDQIVGIVVAQKNNVATPSTIAAVGAAPRLILFAAKAYAAATTVTGLYFDNAFVDKHERRVAERSFRRYQNPLAGG
jgi:hypothetical protein